MSLLPDYPRFVLDSPVGIQQPKNITALQQCVRTAGRTRLIISGSRRSHGDHLVSSDRHVVVDTTALNTISSLEGTILTVEAGCTWDQVQQYALPYGLSPICQQSAHDFTVGGSIAGNIHGRDIHAGTIEHSVEWMEIIMADGSVIRLSRQESPDLFWHMFGSQGTLGIITRVGLRLTNNTYMDQTSRAVPVTDLEDWFEQHRAGITFFIARPNVVALTDKAVVTTWRATAEVSFDVLGQEKYWRRNKLVFWLSTLHPYLLSKRWYLELAAARRPLKVSRSNAMRPPVVSLKMFMTSSKRYSYAVQEIFVPKRRLAEALERIADVSAPQADIRLAGVTLRHISVQEAPLGYAKGRECWAIMQYWKIPRNQFGMTRYAWLQRELAAVCSELDGKVYLSYASLQPAGILLRQYPALRRLAELKKELDPHGVFASDFMDRLMKEMPVKR